MAASSSSPSSFVGRGSSPSSSWPKLMLPDEQLVKQDMNDAKKWVFGVIDYVSPSTTLVSTHRDLSGSDGALHGAEFVPTIVKVYNGRHLDKNLHQHGFQLIPSQISNLNIDFYNQKDVIQQYYPHCEDLVSHFLRNLQTSRTFK